MIYVCSDIHGALNKFEKMLKKINFNDSDTMYILGDVIDRGKKPIDLLLKIMDMPNVILLMGNHEYMMLNCYMKRGYEWQLWYSNGGQVTDEQFLKLPEWEQDIVLDYLYHLPLIIPNLVVNNKAYYLAHSSFSSDPDFVANQSIYKIKEIDIREILWSRPYPFANIINSPVYQKHKHKTLIAGHTIVSRLTHNYTSKKTIFRGCGGHYINLDCGCSSFALGDSTGRLGCLCLDNNKEYYV